MIRVRVYDLGLRVYDLGFRVCMLSGSSLGFRASGL